MVLGVFDAGERFDERFLYLREKVHTDVVVYQERERVGQTLVRHDAVLCVKTADERQQTINREALPQIARQCRDSDKCQSYAALIVHRIAEPLEVLRL